mmetsp:Transcript_3121/g.5364  ORF Transcript_3121/g.5364 Transcript_3121/m.5364 type:complete len:323 (-) Transcript_3121:1634-2602(-)
MELAASKSPAVSTPKGTGALKTTELKSPKAVNFATIAEEFGTSDASPKPAAIRTKSSAVDKVPGGASPLTSVPYTAADAENARHVKPLTTSLSASNSTQSVSSASPPTAIKSSSKKEGHGVPKTKASLPFLSVQHPSGTESTGTRTPKLFASRSQKDLGASSLSRNASQGFLMPVRNRSARNQPYHSDEEWKSILKASEYKVLRSRNMEAPFSGKYFQPHGKDGVYLCRGCENPVFSSRQHTISGRGWATYLAPLPRRTYQEVATRDGGEYFEILCAVCDCFLGLRKSAEGDCEICSTSLQFRYVLEDQQEKLSKGKQVGPL